jgi:hypothetical protein
MYALRLCNSRPFSSPRLPILYSLAPESFPHAAHLYTLSGGPVDLEIRAIRIFLRAAVVFSCHWPVL